MSERRQFALFVVGLVTLAAVGFVSATLFPEPCEGLVEVGELPLAFTDAVDALPLSEQRAVSLERVGQDAGVGPWRGAVALPDDARVLPSEFGFFVVTDEAFTVLRPSMGLVSAARSREGLEVVPTGTSLALRAADGRTGVYNGEYEQERCGRLPPDAEVLALDRGIAVLDDGSEVRAVTLSGSELFGGTTADVAHVADASVVLGEGKDLELVDSRGGDVLDRVTGPLDRPTTPWISAAGDQLLVRAEGGVRPITVQDDALTWQPVVPLPLAPTSDLLAVTTPAGIVAAGPVVDGGGSSVAGLATDRSDRAVPVPPDVVVQSLHASADGHVGVVASVDGARALLVYGRDAEGRDTTE